MADLNDMNLFVAAVRAGSLSAGGRVVGMSPAVASKRIARLESQLNARLLQRSSRRMTLTEAGALYFDRCRAILADIEEAEALVARDRKQVKGTLRVSATSALGRRWVGPVAASFAARHRDVVVRLWLTDELVDLYADGIDCAVRVGAPADSALIARELAPNRRVVCGAPDYLAKHGAPEKPDDLRRHECLVLSTSTGPSRAEWAFRSPDGGTVRMPVTGRLVSNNGQQVRDWVLAGHGLAWRSVWDVADELADGRLVEVLGAWSQVAAPISAVYPSRKQLPARTRLFIDELAKHFAHGAAKQKPA